MVDNDLQELAELAWETYRANYHSSMSAMMNGDGGSTGSAGAGILQVRSGSTRVAISIRSAIEQLNGSGEVPDTNALLSFAESEGQSVEDFTVTVLCLMFLMDGVYLIHGGRKDMVVQMFKNFMREEEPPITLESTRLKTRGPKETTPSQEQEDVSMSGGIIRGDPIKQSAPPKKSKPAKVSVTLSTSPKGKASAKKTKKSGRKSRVRGKKVGGSTRR